MLKLFKKHWFGFFLSLFVLLYLTVFLFVLFSPKSDKQNRGFIPCTKQMAVQMLENKEQSSLQLVKIIIENTYCDAKVVAKGFVDWVNGEQSTPWENYFFEPEPEQQSVYDEAELLKFYEENPYFSKDMEELDKKRKELEQKLEQRQIEKDSKIMKPFEVKEQEIEDKEQTNDK